MAGEVILSAEMDSELCGAKAPNSPTDTCAPSWLLAIFKLTQNKFPPIHQLIAEGSHVVVEFTERVGRVFAKNFRAHPDFRFEALLHRVEDRKHFFLGENRGADFSEPG